MPMKHYNINEEWVLLGKAPLGLQVQEGKLRVHSGDQKPDAQTLDYVLASDERDGFPRAMKFSQPENIYGRAHMPRESSKIVVVT